MRMWKGALSLHNNFWFQYFLITFLSGGLPQYGRACVSCEGVWNVRGCELRSDGFQNSNIHSLAYCKTSLIMHTHLESWYKARSFLLPVMECRGWGDNEERSPCVLMLQAKKGVCRYEITPTSHTHFTSARWERKAMLWTVFPNPISSASIPLMPWSYRLASQFIPFSWYTFSFPLNMLGWGTSLSDINMGVARLKFLSTEEVNSKCKYTEQYTDSHDSCSPAGSWSVLSFISL